MHHTWLRDTNGRLVDEALLTVMRAPRTFTGEDVVELGLHGGAVCVRRTLRALLAAGATSFAALDSALVALRSQGLAGNRVVVAAEDGVRCASLVACLDRCHGVGFDEVSLADGLAQPLPTLVTPEASPR